jgi:hypothetical protein
LPVDDVDEMLDVLSASFSQSASDPRSPNRVRSFTNEAIEDHRRVEQLFSHIANGDREDEVAIQELILSDPKRWLISDPNEMLVN